MFSLEISMKDILMSLSNAIDMASPLLTGHHKRVAYIAWNLAHELKMTEREKADIVAASLIHDIGCLSLQDRLDIMDYEAVDADYHCNVGYLILKEFKPLRKIAEIIRFHHYPWHLKSENDLVNWTYLSEADVIHLADRVESLIDGERGILSQEEHIFSLIKNDSELRFNPEVVDAFESLRKKEAFWLYLSDTYIDGKLEEYISSYPLLLHSDDMVAFSKVFSYMIDFKSQFTVTHTSGVTAVAKKLAELSGFSDREISMIEIAGNLHDIGKLAVPREILEKNAGLDFDEFSVIRGHTFHTYNILKPIKGLETINQWASYHHESLEGSGYPFHLGENELSTGSRIVKVADIFTALSEDRPYRKGMDKDEILRTFHELILMQRVDANVFNILKENFEEINLTRKNAQTEAKGFYNAFRKNLEKLAG